MTACAPPLLASLKRVAALLRDAEIRFALAGGMAAWAMGGPPTAHDVDLLVHPGDVDDALAALERAGLRTERPPEGWLAKVYDGDVMVDLIFELRGVKAGDAILAAPWRDVAALEMRVLAPPDFFTAKLLALNEHHLDFGPLLEHARALREQVDWAEVAGRTQSSPYARAFVHLLGELGISGLDRRRPPQVAGGPHRAGHHGADHG